jgi:hypothetical protein
MATYAHIENNTITGVYDLIPDNWRNISNFFVFKDNIEEVRSLGWRVVQPSPNPTFNIDTQKLSDLKYSIVGDEVIEYRDVEDLPIPVVEPQIEFTEQQMLDAKIARHNVVMNELRIKRNLILAASDYTQLSDIIAQNGTELTSLFVIYRQTLRDLPSIYEDNLDFNDVNSAEFPEIPVYTAPPVVEETPPVVEEIPPVVEETPPAVEETPPVVEETPPAVEETPPVVEETPPVVEETPLTDPGA